MGAVGANVTPAAVQKDYPFDPLRDYVPVAMVAEWSAILVVKKDLPVATLAEFVAYAKARPGALNFGTTGYGSFAHLVSEVPAPSTKAGPWGWLPLHRHRYLRAMLAASGPIVCGARSKKLAPSMHQHFDVKSRPLP